MGVAADLTEASWPVFNRLLDEALELPPGERLTWLEALGAEHDRLKPALRALLEKSSGAETRQWLSTLPRSAAALPAVDEPDLAAGTLVGPYRLLRELGVGGMGAVWLAKRADGAFTRDVALKLPMLSRLRRDLAQRFARERDILARLEHPHIARLYDAGVSDGLPYLAMEYVDGQPITAYCDAHRLTVAQRLGLFTQVLDAVQYAHANLVIHRDLKPSNILVTADGQARLLDFGIAKLLADADTARETQLTRLAGRALTPDYASPEQIKGEPLTIATDIYSLGVVLYELLAGSRPYRLKVQSAAQLEQAIIEAEPPRPSGVADDAAAIARSTSRSRLIRALKGDLDTVVLKALAKAPSSRYQTGAEFGQDLQAVLTSTPVRARRASWAYRARKFVERNRLPVALATGFGITLFAATLLSLWQAERAQQEARRAEAVKDFVLSIFESADTNAGSGRKTTALDVLTQAHQRLREKPTHDSAIDVELLSSIGFSLVGLGEYQQALPILAEATRLAVAQLGDSHARTAAARLAYGEALVMTDDKLAASEMLDAAARDMRRLDNPVGLVQAVRWQSILASQQGRHGDALPLAEEAVRLAEARLPPEQRRVLMEAYMTHANALYVARKPGRLAAAERAYQASRDVYGDRVAAPVLTAQSIRAVAEAIEGDPRKGIAELRAVALRQIEFLGPDHNDVALTYGRLGIASATRGDAMTAAESFRQVLRIKSVSAGGKPTEEVADQHFNLGVSLLYARHYAEAEAELRRAAAILASLLDRRHVRSKNVQLQSYLAVVLVRTGRVAESAAILEALTAQPIENPISEALIKSALGVVRRAQGQYDAAAALLGEGVEFFAARSLRFQQATALSDLGVTLLAQKRNAEALTALMQARALVDELHPDGSADRAETLTAAARALLAAGRSDEALQACDAALQDWDASRAERSGAAATLLVRAHALASLGKHGQARSEIDRAVAMMRTPALPEERHLLAEARRAITRSSP